MKLLTLIHKNKRLKLIFFFNLIITFVFSQDYKLSPYSMYGIGELSNISNTRSASMAGIGIANRNSSFLNLVNPASLSGIRKQSFIFSLGAKDVGLSLKSANEKAKTGNTSFDYISFGFPVNKIWSMGIMLSPYSKMSYSTNDIDSIAGIGDVNYIHSGSGSLNTFKFGNAFKIHKNLTLGFNFNYIFGTLTKTSTALLPSDSVNSIYSIRNNYIKYVNDVFLEYGLQYHKAINDKENIILGITYTPETKINVSYDALTQRLLNNIYQTVKDTISTITDEKTNFIMPSKIGIGLSYNIDKKFDIELNVVSQQWKDYLFNNKKDSLTNSLYSSLGIEYCPKYGATAFFKKLQYRTGVYFSQLNLKLNNNKINQYGMSFGIGIPITSKTEGEYVTSYLNLGYELGERGTTKDGLIKENYNIFRVGFTFNDIWFIKRKYN